MSLHARELWGDLVDRWRQHRSARAAIDELAALDQTTLAEIAHDMRLSVEDLLEVTAKGAGADQLMERMMEAHGLSPERLRFHMPGMMREMAVLCSRCEVKGRCRAELDAGTAGAHAHAFCPNSATFEGLRESDRSVLS